MSIVAPFPPKLSRTGFVRAWGRMSHFATDSQIEEDKAKKDVVSTMEPQKAAQEAPEQLPTKETQSTERKPTKEACSAERRARHDTSSTLDSASHVSTASSLPPIKTTRVPNQQAPDVGRSHTADIQSYCMEPSQRPVRSHTGDSQPECLEQSQRPVRSHTEDLNDDNESLSLSPKAGRAFRRAATEPVSSAESSSTSAGGSADSLKSAETMSISSSEDLDTVDVGSDLLPGATASIERKMERLFETLESLPIHLVCLWDRNFLSNSKGAPCEVPRAVKAAVIAFPLHNLETAKLFMSKLSIIPKCGQPIIVMFVQDDDAINPDLLFKAQAQLLAAGAHETLLQRSTGSDLKLDVEMSVRKAWAIMRKTQNEKDEALLMSDNKKFWPCVPKVFDHFPQLQDMCPSLECGSQIGSNTILEQINKGSHGRILKVEDASGAIKALKVISKLELADVGEVAAVWSEIMLLRKLTHPNILELSSAIQTLDHIVLSMEFIGRRNLYHSIRDDLSVAKCKDIVELQRQIIDGIAYIHDAGVAHRDIKPENIAMLDVEHRGIKLKIVDFGCAVKASQPCYTCCGTVPFIAPEMVLKCQDEVYDALSTDVWACGVVFLEMLCGLNIIGSMLGWTKRPAPSAAYGAQITKLFSMPHILKEMKLELGLTDRMQSTTQELLLGMLRLDPSLRWKADKVRASSWLQL